MSASTPALDHVGLGVAGGLDARTIPLLAPLLDLHSDLSWDAEGRLHPALRDGTRPLALDAVTDYLHASATLLGLPAGDHDPAAVS